MLPDGAAAASTQALDREVRQRLAENSAISVRSDLSGRDITTFAIGGPLRALAEVGSAAALQQLLRTLNDFKIDFTVVGAGSNLLIDDLGVDRWIIRLGSALKTLEIENNLDSDVVRLTVGGAYPLMALSRDVCARGLAGLAFAGGIPASLGGAVRMNAGAHGGEMSQIVESVSVVRSDGRLEQLTAAEMQFSYRHSVIAAGDVVVSASLLLRRSTPDLVQEERAHCLEERRSRQPLSQPSAGSVFKNPSAQLSAGALIEQVGLKGQRIGDVEISSKHANWIVNPLKRGKAQDVCDLIALCQERVEREFSVALHPELIVLRNS